MVAIMATRLRSILVFANVPAGGSASQAHGLNVNGVHKVPDHIVPSVAGFSVVATSTTVTVTNGGAAQASVDVLAEYWYSATRAMATDPLVVDPFAENRQHGSQPGGTSHPAATGGLGGAAGFATPAMVDAISAGGPIRTPIVALVDAPNIATDTTLGNVFEVTLAGTRVLDNPTGVIDGFTYIYVIHQNGAGNHALTYGNNFLWEGGTAPPLSTAGNATDMIACVAASGKLLSTLSRSYS